MKLALFGYGNMGQLIERLALSQGDEITAKISQPILTPLHLKQIKEADVCLDFSHADCVLKHLDLCIDLKKPLVIGTTGWDKHLPEAKKKIEQSSIGCLFSPNFSIGIYFFTQLLKRAGELMNRFDEYDICALEHHHKHKADCPSGTAKMLANILNQQLTNRSPVAFTGLRSGHVPGTHTISFDSPADTITLTHQARNREGFARGALKAAAWIQDKQGFFTFEDCFTYHANQVAPCS